VRYRLEYAAVLVATFIVKRLPWSAVRGLGTLLGRTFYALDRTHRRVAISNLTAAFPTRSTEECRTIARNVFAHFGRVLLELLRFSTLRPDEMRQLVEFEGDERARQAYSLGNGVIFLTAHFGFWEFNGIVHALQLGPIGLLARPLDNPYLNAVLERVRRCTGNTIIYRRGAIRRIMRELRANRGVAMLIDQHVHTPDAVLVDFFNRPAATSSSVARLALRTGAPVIPVIAIPLPGGRYRMIYEPPVEPPPPDSPDAIREFTQRCTDVLEMYVRRYPELWLWMHRRWRDNGRAGDHVPGMFPRAGRNGDADAGEEDGS
jgi:Kdo2-lipid IVA lauroyltransferase/acyltransferase